MKWYNWRYQTILFHMSENEQETKELLVQLELDLISGVDDSLVLRPNQYSTRERTFRGGTILNETEFKILPPDVADLLHSAKRDQIIPEHERMRFDEPANSVQDEYPLTETQRLYYQNTAVGKGTGEIVEIDWLPEVNSDEAGSILSPQGVKPFSRENRNQVFSAELINRVNKEREWTGGVIVSETDFTDDSKRSTTNEIREMVITISQHLGHEMRETPQGFFVYAGDKVLKISRSGFIRHWFSAESFSGFDDYEFWIEKVRLEGKGTPLANHAAYHVSKRKLA